MNKLKAKFLGVLCMALLSVGASAQYSTEVILTGTPNPTLKANAERNISMLLDSCNTAYLDDREIGLDEIKANDRTKTNIQAMWANSPFRCNETEIIERCLATLDGNYQVRNLPLYAKDENDEPVYQESVVTFDKEGTIVDFHIAIDNNLYLRVLKKGSDVTDLRYRQIILDYVEQFRTAYNTKDLPFLDQIFSDDALIITGKVIKSVPTDMNSMMPQEKVIYTKQSKKQYLERLAVVFKRNKRIHVTFDEVKVLRHPSKTGFYGVTLRQGYSSDGYSDEGYVFLLWDFNNPESPKIHVRTWQPEYLDTGKTKKLPEEEIFTCMDFDVN